MTWKPVVSVVMSVYNGLPFLHQAVESILHQTFVDLEFIVVDDASRDASWEVLSTYAAADRRIVLLRNERNLGYTLSLNEGIRRARGRYIARQDADDVSMPERLTCQVRFLESNPEVGLVGTLPRFIDDQDDVQEIANYPLLVDGDSIKKQLLDSNCIRHGSVVIRRSALDVVGLYDPGLEPSEDYDLWLRLSEVTRLANIPEALYLYRQHSNSESSKRRYAQMQNKAVALERAMSRRYGDTPPRRLQNLVARDYMRAAYLGFAEGRRAEAQASLESATAVAPWILTSGTVIRDVIVRYIQTQSTPDAFELLGGLFDDLLPQTRHLARARSWLRSRMHMREVFDGDKNGRAGKIDEHLLAGIREDPRWLLNRGVWAIGLQRLVRRRQRPTES